LRGASVAAGLQVSFRDAYLRWLALCCELGAQQHLLTNHIARRKRVAAGLQVSFGDAYLR